MTKAESGGLLSLSTRAARRCWWQATSLAAAKVVHTRLIAKADRRFDTHMPRIAPKRK